MAVEVLLPKIGFSMNEGELVVTGETTTGVPQP